MRRIAALSTALLLFFSIATPVAAATPPPCTEVTASSIFTGIDYGSYWESAGRFHIRDQAYHYSTTASDDRLSGTIVMVLDIDGEIGFADFQLRGSWVFSAAEGTWVGTTWGSETLAFVVARGTGGFEGLLLRADSAGNASICETGASR